MEIVQLSNSGDSHLCRRAGVAALLIVWAVMTAVAFARLWVYEATPGAKGNAPGRLQEAAVYSPGKGAYTLMVFLHPECPCSEATVNELGRIVAQTGEGLVVRVVFVKADLGNDQIERTSLYSAARAIPGVSVEIDTDGWESTRYGALTSGQAVLYDPVGKLLFSGGITAARGHAGDNVGESAVISFVRGNRTAPDHTPVFGCSLN